MAEKKQLVLVVEGTVALGPYWRVIVSDYLEKFIRKFCGNEATVELALVQFNAHGSYSSCLVQRSGWARNVDYYLEWLSCMNFSGGGFCDAAIAEGLAEVLMMCPAPDDTQTQPTEALQRHCILVAGSNPYALPTPVYCPPNKSETQSVSCLFDAEAVAKLFPQSCVSLSVICPKQLPKLKAIYNAGQRNPSTTAPAIDSVKNPHFLILISENFMEACAALSPAVTTNAPSNQTPINMEVTSVSQPPPTASAVNESLVSVQNIPLATVKVEPGITDSPLLTSQELKSSNDNFADVKPVVSNIQQPLHSAGPVNLSILSQARPAVLSRSGSASLQSNSNMGTKVGLSQPTSRAPQSGQSKYVKIWEGEICGKRQNQTVTITRLEAYSNSSSAELIAKDWPSRLLIDRLVSQDQMNLMSKRHTGKCEYIVCRALNQHGFLGQMQEKKLCSVIRLPSQTLLLTISDKAYRLIGMLYPEDMVVFKPHIPSRVGPGMTQGAGAGTGAGGPSQAQLQGAGAGPGPVSLSGPELEPE